MKKNVLFVGLGRMGSPMAKHLADSNTFDVSVTNRSPEKVTKWVNQYQGNADQPSQIYDLVILCIGNDQDVRQQLLGDNGLINRVRKGGVIVDHTTTSAELARDMSQSAIEHGVGYLDAPVSGGEAGAINGQLSCMVGGAAADLEKVSALLQCYCKQVTHIGDAGAGQIAKMANQFCIAGTLAGLSEAINLLQHSGVDCEQAFNAIKGGAAQSWQMDNRFTTMVNHEFDFGFAIDHMIKDLGYALQQAEQQPWQPEISTQIHRWYKALSEQGHNTRDTSCLIKHYQK